MRRIGRTVCFAAVVCESIEGEAAYPVKEYSVTDGDVTEEKTYLTEELPRE